MIDAAGIRGKDPETALKDGSAMDHWRRMIIAQGGNPEATLPVAKESHTVVAASTGTITTIDAMKVGVSAWRLGAGRSKQGETVQAGAGITMHAKPGDVIKAGDPLFTLFTDESPRFERALQVLEGAVTIIEGGVAQQLPLVIERIV